MIGNIAALGALTANGFSGWMGVPKAGDEDGIAEDGGTAPRCFRNIGAGVLSMIWTTSLAWQRKKGKKKKTNFLYMKSTWFAN
jgi:hypothetical protein